MIGTFKPSPAGIAVGLTAAAVTQMDPSVLKDALEKGLIVADAANPMTLGYDLGYDLVTSAGNWLFGPPANSGAIDPLFMQSQSPLGLTALSQLPIDMQEWGQQNLGKDYTLDNMLTYLLTGTIPATVAKPGESTEVASILNALASTAAKPETSSETEI